VVRVDASDEEGEPVDMVINLFSEEGRICRPLGAARRDENGEFEVMCEEVMVH